MASEPKTEPIPTAETSKPAAFPGYREAVEVVDRAGTYLKKQADLWNGAWTEVVAGQFTFGKWLALTATSVDEHFKFLRGYLSAPPGMAKTPPWVALTLTPRDKIVSAATFLTEPLLTPMSPPVPFSQLGHAGSVTYLTPSVEVIPDGRLNVTVNIDAEGPHKGVRPQPGRYIAFLFASGKHQAPILIVLLDVAKADADATSVPMTQR
jgi:hypothetical protein